MHKKTIHKSETRLQILTALGPLAWLALFMSIFFGSIENPDFDFLTGSLVGFSIVGNLVYIFVVTRNLRENRRQK